MACSTEVSTLASPSLDGLGVVLPELGGTQLRVSDQRQSKVMNEFMVPCKHDCEKSQY